MFDIAVEKTDDGDDVFVPGTLVENIDDQQGRLYMVVRKQDDNWQYTTGLMLVHAPDKTKLGTVFSARHINPEHYRKVSRKITFYF